MLVEKNKLIIESAYQAKKNNINKKIDIIIIYYEQ